MNGQNSEEVVTGIFDGALYVGAANAQPVVSISQNLVEGGYRDLGLFSDEGTTDTLPDAAAPTVVRAFQRAQVVRTVTAPSDDVPTRQVTLLQTNPLVIESILGATVHHGLDGEIWYDVDSDRPRPHLNIVRDLITETAVEREWWPNAVVTSIGDRVANNDGTTRGWPVTFSLNWSPRIQAHYRVFSTTIPLDDQVDDNGNPLFAPSHADVAVAEEAVEEVVEAVAEAQAPETVIAFTVPDLTNLETEAAASKRRSEVTV